MKKMRKFLFFKIIIGLIVLAGFSFAIIAGTIIDIEQDLNFSILRPVRGTYRNSVEEAARVTISTDEKVNISFQATSLEYNGNYLRKREQPTLNITYWIKEIGIADEIISSRSIKANGNQFYDTTIFENVNIDRLTGFTKRFIIDGEVNIESIAAQPAGEYTGEIFITVSAVE